MNTKDINISTTFKFFIKGDISGIQEFIFNVKSQKAARVLRARSIFVQMLSAFTQQWVEYNFDGTEKFYNGGGTFYLKLKSKQTFEEAHRRLKVCEAAVNKSIQKEDIYVSLSIVENHDNKSFQEVWKDLAKASNRDKLERFQKSIATFEPYDYDILEKDQTSEDFEEESLQEKLELDNTTNIKKFKAKIFNFLNRNIAGEKLKYEASSLYDSIKSDLPQWEKDLFEAFKEDIEEENKRRKLEANEGETVPDIKEDSIIDYHFLAKFAYLRTGTRKIGILKMDIDNLGSLFSELPKAKEKFIKKDVEEAAKKISKTLSNFFNDTIYDLLNEDEEKLKKEYPEIEVEKFKDKIYPSVEDPESVAKASKFNQNIYTIFSGGDDCIFVGSWDAILHWTKVLREKFDIYCGKKIKSIIHGIARDPDEIDISLPPTLSAGIVIVEPTYPVIRFAELVEDVLNDAKIFTYTEEDKAEKNKVSLFGEVITWEEYKKVTNLAKDLATLVKEHNEQRSTIAKLKDSAAIYQRIHKEIKLKKRVNIGISKLFYFARNTQNEEALSKSVIIPYSKDLIDSFAGIRNNNPMKYAMAARWAEFLTRKN
ncbi:MAG: hypothetical protein AAF573_15390 [Bacteroidota bacterium]